VVLSSCREGEGKEEEAVVVSDIGFHTNRMGRRSEKFNFPVSKSAIGTMKRVYGSQSMGTVLV